jgi:phage host-nuclease inhibitor protein Gam
MMAINEIDVLNEALDQEVEQEFAQQNSGFVIDNIDKLDWAVRKCLKTDRDANAKIECAQRQIIRLNAYIQSVKEDAQRNLDSLHLMMEPFTRQLLEGGKAKSFKTPSGKISFRSQQPEIEKDDDELVKFLKDNKRTDLIETKEKPKWGDFKKELTLAGDKYITKDGEVAPVKVTLREDKMIVEG